MRDKNLLLYWGLTFLISWGIWILLIITGKTTQWLFWIAGFGPTLAALGLTALKTGRSGVRNLFRPGWRVGLRWYFFSLLGTPLVMLTALGLQRILGGDWPHYTDPNHLVTSPEQWPLIFVVFGYIFIFTALGEEIGWRAFALPRLQVHFSPFTASLILGMVWAFWHLPLFWLAGNFHQDLPFTWFLLQILGSTFLYTWLYQRTHGSLLIALLFHTSSNAAVGLLPILPLDNNGSLRPLWLVVILLWLVVGVIVLLDRKYFFRDKTKVEHIKRSAMSASVFNEKNKTADGV